MKKIISNILSAILSCAFLLPIAGCVVNGTQSTDGGDTSSSVEAQTGGYLALSDYNVKIKVGETLSLGVKRYNDKDEEQEIKEKSFSSESPAFVSVSADGTITALREGEAYVNVEADGLEASVFVTVQSASTTTGLVIRFSSQKLYKGVPIQAQAFIVEESITVGVPTEVTWSVEDDDVLEITETGQVTPKAIAESAVVKASCTYAGKTYTAELQIAVVEPIYYAFSRQGLKLASVKTASGAKNESWTSVGLEIKKINALDGTATTMPSSGIDVKVKDEELAALTVAESGAITVQSKALGETLLQATVKETSEAIGIPLEIVTPISTIADMDAIALAVYNEAQSYMLASSYMLVNDIDYQGDVIMPISSTPYSTATTDAQAGIQWMYRLDVKDGVYSWVDREDFGAAGTGLTKEEFSAFATFFKGKTLFHKAFSGTFDGNGYAIKNGQLFYGAWVACGAKTANWASTAAGVFGVLSGTLKNIGFENITMQNPADYLKGAKNEMALSEYGLDRVYTNDGKIVEGETGGLAKTNKGNYKSNSYSLVCKGDSGARLENVYFNFTEGLGERSSGSTGILCSWATGITVNNCVVYTEYVPQQGRYAFCGARSDATSKIANNLVVGHSSFHSAGDLNTLGSNGNWWSGNKRVVPEWKQLFTLKAAENATNVRSVAEVVETFDETVWDMSEFGADKAGRPTLKNGCSI